MSGQLSMDVGRWFGNGPRYVSFLSLTDCLLICFQHIYYAMTCQKLCSFRKVAFEGARLCIAAV